VRGKGFGCGRFVAVGIIYRHEMERCFPRRLPE
jgi:hypothetical protein